MICSAVPVSMMFLLVAPQWTKPPARAGSRARSAFTSGITGFHVRSNSARIARRSRRSTRAARAVARAAARGTRASSARRRAGARPPPRAPRGEGRPRGEEGPETRVEGRPRPVLNFCSNNSLGLSSHPELLKAAHRALDEWGYGMSSVRFICGTQALHLELEKKIAAFLGMQDAILYAACFDANGGGFEPLLGAGDAILPPQLNNPSVIDRVRPGPGE